MTNNQLALVFPGQGPQRVGMLADIAAQYSVVQETFSEASSVLGYDLWNMVQNGPTEELDKTVHAQPALLAGSYAIWRIIQAHLPGKPVVFAGHSLGEYTALVCANALGFNDAIKLVAARGQFMQEAVVPGSGAMAAIIGLDESIVKNICLLAVQSSDDILSPANFNSIGQTVIAGHRPAVERALAIAKEQGAKLAVLIPVSVPSHCKLMEPAARRLAGLLATIPFCMPTTPVLNNVDVMPYDSVDAIRNGLVRQLYMPVRWVETIQTFTRQGVAQIVECGPGNVLTGLNKRIDKNLQLTTTSDVADLTALLQASSSSWLRL
jgi:[acyl-carrier-protein] S-malonyltransferase